MEIAPIPANEQERLQVLRSYQVLDTDPEKELDEIVRLASQICAVPISLISFIDDHRQWFKASVGVTIKETTRDWSFCAHAILQEDTMVVANAASDKRFKHNPLVTGEPGIRFYAGVPLATPSGHPIGTLCVIDDKPRFLWPNQELMLTILAQQVMKHLERKRQSKQLQQNIVSPPAETGELIATLFELTSSLDKSTLTPHTIQVISKIEQITQQLHILMSNPS